MSEDRIRDLILSAQLILEDNIKYYQETGSFAMKLSIESLKAHIRELEKEIK